MIELSSLQVADRPDAVISADTDINIHPMSHIAQVPGDEAKKIINVI